MRVITLDSSKTILSVKNVGDSYVLGTDDVETALGEMGQVQQGDGSFITPPIALVTPQPTLEDKVNYLYYKQMGVI